MKKGTIIILVVALVIIVLASPLFLPGDKTTGSDGNAVYKSADLVIEFSDAETGQFAGSNTTWSIDTDGNWTHVSSVNPDGDTVFRFNNVSFSSNVLDLLAECAKIGNFSINKQVYVGMGTIVLKIDNVANENPGRGWQYYVNGDYASNACDKCTLNSSNDTVVWKFMILKG
jgi:hypothetical protein